jgi:D-alanyl-lipoteichoic acid acyltransferase DltB (MBOAT superfamily)
MLFNSNVFIFWFLPISLVGYYLLAHRAGSLYAKLWLCGASFFFYGWWNPAFLLLLAGSIAFNSWISQYLTGLDETSRRENVTLALGIAANLGLLFYYKYLFPLLGFLHGIGWLGPDYGSVILPLGISFFTFTQIGYLVDCRQGLVKERGLVDYVLFVTFFPHLIAGPILHHREVMPQFADDKTYRFNS